MNLALLLKNKAFSCLSNSVRISVIHTRFENGEKANIFNGLSCYLNGHSVRFVRLSGYNNEAPVLNIEGSRRECCQREQRINLIIGHLVGRVIFLDGSPGSNGFPRSHCTGVSRLR